MLTHLQALERRAGRKIKVPQRALDVQAFFQAATPQERWQILNRHKVDFVIAYADGPTDKQLRHLPGLAIVEMPKEYFKFYEVDRGQPAE